MQSHPVLVAAEFTELCKNRRSQIGVEVKLGFLLFLGREGKKSGVILLPEGANSALLH